MVLARVPVRKAGYTYSKYDSVEANRAIYNFKREKRLLEARVKVYSETGILASMALAILLVVLI